MSLPLITVIAGDASSFHERTSFRRFDLTVDMPLGASPFARALQGMNPAIDAKAVTRGTGLNRFLLRLRHLHQETVGCLESACAYCEEIMSQEPNCEAAYAELSLSVFLLEKLGVARREEIEPKVRWAVDRGYRSMTWYRALQLPVAERQGLPPNESA